MSNQPKESDAPSPTDPGNATVRTGLDRLAHRYYAPLASFFRKRTRNSAEVQDLVQQVFLRLAQHPDIGEIRNAEGYLFQTASNTLKDHIRNTAVRDRHIREGVKPEEACGSDFSPERVLLGRESVARLSDALRQLPERTRDVFMLRCFEGLKHAEIARLQGISTRAVEKHIQRALVVLDQALDCEGRG
jgi:RNA polymerase sigma factor (sigma-70 family)